MVKDNLVKQKEVLFIDAFYKDNSLNLVVKDIKENKKETYIFDFLPYFYLVSKKELVASDLKSLETILQDLTEIIKVKKNNFDYCYKLLFKNIEALIVSRERIQKGEASLSTQFSLTEYDIPFIHRFFLDYQLSNFKKLKINYEDNKIVSFENLDDYPLEKLDYLGFDLEILPPSNGQFPKPENDQIIAIGIETVNEKRCFFLANHSHIEKYKSTKIKDIHTEFFSNEVIMMDAFNNYLSENSTTLIFTYNGDNFDFEYLSKRYKTLTGNEFTFGNVDINYHKKIKSSVSVNGSVHMDVYVLVRLLNYLQVFNYSKLDLNSVYPKITCKEKLSLPAKEMRNSYLSGDYEKIIIYNLDDVAATIDLAFSFSGIVEEMSKIIKTPVFDVLRGSAGVLVEKWFFNYYLENNMIIPNKPGENIISDRMKYTFTGAYVKPPTVGFHRNIAVVDFRSFHISLIITYNISPDTIDCDCCTTNTQSIVEKAELLGHYICKKKVGFVPKLLKDLLTVRIVVKDKMKGLDKKSIEYKSLYAKQYSLKILLASTYGYMGFPGARWYCRDCLEIMYHLVRTKIQDTMFLFEKKGYEVIYGDSDSCFFIFKDIKKLEKDLDDINTSLPESMSLELENTFKSGIFVMSRDSTKAAKKKYALLDHDGNLKIKGFEFVRRDWCPLVKTVQKKIFEIILEKEDPKKAITYFREVISKLNNKEIENKDLIIQTLIHKKLGNYKTINPAMSALLLAKKEGHDIKAKEIVEFIVTGKSGKTISDKARLFEYTDEGDYDVDYYINNQLLPAIFPILEVFKVTKDELISKKKQKGLGDFQ